MDIVALARHLRHGRLRHLGPAWLFLGRFYRAAIKLLPATTVAQRIGAYGPFRLDAHFAFSDFENWGGGHNNGFDATIEACRGKKCVLDIGGHVGLVALPMSRVLAEGGKVFTFEPAAANLRYLRRHIAANGIENIEVVDSLVGASDGRVEFFEQPNATGQNSLVIKKNPELYNKIERVQVSLDTFCGARRLRPEVIKIDVEGGEFSVLQGARETLAECRPVVFLSVHPRELELMGSSVEALKALVFDLGYQCSEIDGSPVKQFRLAEYLLMPQERVSLHAF